MRLLKYYGRTMSGTIRRIKKELGGEALVVESRSIKPGSRSALLNPGARIEITVSGMALERVASPDDPGQGRGRGRG